MVKGLISKLRPIGLLFFYFILSLQSACFLKGNSDGETSSGTINGSEGGGADSSNDEVATQPTWGSGRGIVIATFENSRSRCGFQETGTRSYRVDCEVVASVAGVELRADVAAPGTKFNWTSLSLVEGAPILPVDTATDCSTDRDGLSLSCPVRVIEGDSLPFSKVAVTLNVNLQNNEGTIIQSKNEKSEVTLSYGVQTHGMVPQIPVSYLPPSENQSRSASPSLKRSLLSTLGVKEELPLKPVGYQSQYFAGSEVILDDITSVCAGDNGIYFSAGNFVYFMDPKTRKATIFAGSGQDESVNHLPRPTSENPHPTLPRLRIRLGDELLVACHQAKKGRVFVFSRKVADAELTDILHGGSERLAPNFLTESGIQNYSGDSLSREYEVLMIENDLASAVVNRRYEGPVENQEEMLDSTETTPTYYYKNWEDLEEMTLTNNVPFGHVNDIVSDSKGNLYVADGFFSRIYKVYQQSGIWRIETHAGAGTIVTDVFDGMDDCQGICSGDCPCHTTREAYRNWGADHAPSKPADNVAAKTALLNNPRGMAVDSEDRLLFVDGASPNSPDAGGMVVRRVSEGRIYNIVDFLGEANPLNMLDLQPRADGKLLAAGRFGYVGSGAGTGPFQIVELTPGETTTTPSAGGASYGSRPPQIGWLEALTVDIYEPYAMTMQGGSIFFNSNRAGSTPGQFGAIFEITEGKVGTAIGSTGTASVIPDGPAWQRQLRQATDIALHPNGVIYFIDSETWAVHKLSPGENEAMKVTHVAGYKARTTDFSTSCKYDGSNADPAVAPSYGVRYQSKIIPFANPSGLTIDDEGNLLIADTGHDRIFRLIEGDTNELELVAAGDCDKLDLSPGHDILKEFNNGTCENYTYSEEQQDHCCFCEPEMRNHPEVCACEDKPFCPYFDEAAFCANRHDFIAPIHPTKMVFKNGSLYVLLSTLRMVVKLQSGVFQFVLNDFPVNSEAVSESASCGSNTGCSTSAAPYTYNGTDFYPSGLAILPDGSIAISSAGRTSWQNSQLQETKGFILRLANGITEKLNLETSKTSSNFFIHGMVADNLGRLYVIEANQGLIETPDINADGNIEVYDTEGGERLILLDPPLTGDEWKRTVLTGGSAGEGDCGTGVITGQAEEEDILLRIKASLSQMCQARIHSLAASQCGQLVFSQSFAPRRVSLAPRLDESMTSESPIHKDEKYRAPAANIVSITRTCHEDKNN